ncbi:hypothetical protein IUY40_08610 [Flavobacterium sp. ALJ2]|uniref:hypothetical protein n=1 Tax=Flavobacterium sp. ALJ2 TaxID=2786960 RepID=UPI00189E1D89|nr:hypothetical protein [Flavobacterium sp. ALJ2]MBF7091600.1 hypothetical protein [Flavobacterium sp. ALJ2]
MLENKETEELIRAFTNKTIVELDFIIRNSHSHSDVKVNVAKHLIEKKRDELRTKNIKISKKINELICQQSCFDFHVLSFDGYKLIIGGSMDLSYYHKLEIIFEDIFFVSGFFRGWHSNTEKTVFLIPDNEIELNQKY